MSESLADHIAAMETPEAPAPAETAAPVVETPVEAVAPTAEDEASSVKPDAELSEAARTLRRNRADERKAKIQREIDEAVRQREETRAEVERLRHERDELTRASKPVSLPVGSVPTDPNDPAPTEADFPDDYAAFLTAQARHAARQEFRTQQAQTRERIERDRQVQNLTVKAEKLNQSHDAARAKFSDYDAVVEPFVLSLRGSSRGQAVGDFLAESEVAGELAYRLAASPELASQVSASASPAALMRVLARVEDEILAPKRGPKPTTAAPVPPAQMVGGSAAAVADDPNSRSLREHMRIENAKDAARRKRLA